LSEYPHLATALQDPDRERRFYADIDSLKIHVVCSGRSLAQL
jgi:hypothetical protein